MNKRGKNKKFRVVALTPSTNVTTTTFCGGKKKNVASGCTVLVCFKRMYFSAVWLLIFSIVHLLLRRFRVALLRPLESHNPRRRVR